MQTLAGIGNYFPVKHNTDAFIRRLNKNSVSVTGAHVTPIEKLDLPWPTR
jgi:hypothetical protein